MNLIDNALEAFEEDRAENRIEIRASFDESSERVRIVVADNGAGIDAKDLGRLFQPYFSTKGRGTGLGLAIVQRIVRDHHGTIIASRNNGRGSRFSIFLPVRHEDP